MAFATSQSIDQLLTRGLSFRLPNNAPISSLYTLYANGAGMTYWSNSINPRDLSTLSSAIGEVGSTVSFQGTEISTLFGEVDTLSTSLSTTSNAIIDILNSTITGLSTFSTFYADLAILSNATEIGLSTLSTAIGVGDAATTAFLTSTLTSSFTRGLLSTSTGLYDYTNLLSSATVFNPTFYSTVGSLNNIIFSTSTGLNNRINAVNLSLSTNIQALRVAVTSTNNNFFSTISGYGPRIGNLETTSTGQSTITSGWISSQVGVSQSTQDSLLNLRFALLSSYVSTVAVTAGAQFGSISTLSSALYETIAANNSTNDTQNSQISTLARNLSILTTSSILAGVYDTFIQLEEYTVNLINSTVNTINFWQSSLYYSTIIQNQAISEAYFSTFTGTAYLSTVSATTALTNSFVSTYTSTAVGVLYSTNTTFINNNNSTTIGVLYSTGVSFLTSSIDVPQALASTVVFIGSNAGATLQGARAVAIGADAGRSNQGANAVAIGSRAGFTNQSSATIVLNASGVSLNTAVASSFYVSPVRRDENITGGFLHYNTTTREIVYNEQSGTAAPALSTFTMPVYLSSINNLGNLFMNTLQYGTGLRFNNFATGATSLGYTAVTLGLSCSSNGQYVLAPVNTNNNSDPTIAIKVSSDYGTSFVDRLTSSISGVQFETSATSASGQYMIVLSALSGDIFGSGNFGVSWNRQAFDDFVAIAMNSSGQYRAAVDQTNNLTTSDDFGATWNYNVDTLSGNNHIALDDSGILYYTDGNTLFQQMIFPFPGFIGLLLTATINDFAIDYTGTYFLVGCVGSLRVTSNYQLGFTTVLTNTAGYARTTVSGSGQYMLAIDLDTGNYVRSIDYGSSWSSVTSPVIPSPGPPAIGYSGLVAYLSDQASGAGDVYRASNAAQPIVVSTLYKIGVNNENPQYTFDVAGSLGARAVTLSSIVFGGNNVAIGLGAGLAQGAGSVAIGSNAGSNAQGVASIAIGEGAGVSAQGENSVAIGKTAGGTNQNSNSVAIGTQAGNSAQGDFSVAIGSAAAFGSQGNSAIAIGGQAGQNSQGQYGIAIGSASAFVNQQSHGVAIGNLAGGYNQTTMAVAIGRLAGSSNQGNSGVAIGQEAGCNAQGQLTVAIGGFAGRETQGSNAVALGYDAARDFQGSNAVAIGWQAGYTSQGVNAVAIGYQAGLTTQGVDAVAVGRDAGKTSQQTLSVAVGLQAGCNAQAQLAVAVGSFAGRETQGSNAVAVGYDSGRDFQGSNAVAIGWRAGHISQGSNAIAIGYQAGCNSQNANSIVLNASGTALNTGEAGLFVDPVRNDAAVTGGFVHYNTATKELVYNETGGGGGGGGGDITSTFTMQVYLSSIQTLGDLFINTQNQTQIIPYSIGAARSFSGTITDMTCSLDGSIVVIAVGNDLKISNDFGVSFTTAFTTYNGYRKIAMSSNGQYILVALNAFDKLLRSNDYGVNFVPVNNPTPPIPPYNDQANFWSVAVSPNGQYMSAVGDNANVGFPPPPYTTKLFVSYDFGNDNQWIIKHDFNAVLFGVSGFAMDTNANKFIVTDGAVVRSSTNGGASFLDYTFGGPPFEFIQTVSSDANLSYLLIGTDAGFHLSTDNGLSFTNKTPGSPISISYSAVSRGDGQYMVVSDAVNSILYSSSDFGTTWAAALPGAGGFGPEALSYDGSIGYFATNGSGLLYYSEYSSTKQFQNIGVNTSTPTATLDISGSLIASSITVGVTSPSFTLQLGSDSAAKPTTNTWTVSSDKRIKKDIVSANLTICLSTLQQLPLRYFEWDSSFYGPNVTKDRHALGFIAQEIKPILPKTVEIISGSMGLSDFHTLNVDQIYKMHVGATQRLAQLVDASADFKGTHRCFSAESLTSNTGKIVVATGGHAALRGGVPVCGLSGVGGAPIVALSRNARDRRVLGVVAADAAAGRVLINSAGEGSIWVCEANGSVFNGDYITTSDVDGYGEKQGEEYVANFTVAKATMDCDFTAPALPKLVATVAADGSVSWAPNGDAEPAYTLRYVTQTGAELSQKEYVAAVARGDAVYRAALIGCTYHSG